jgi:putative ABC transport system permease protein
MPRFASPAVPVQFFVSLVVIVLSATAMIDAAEAPPSILLSRQLAAKAGVSVGDVVTLATGADGSGAMKFRVAGIYEPTPDPMRFTAQRLEAHMHLADLLTMAADPGEPEARETVGAINVKLANPGDAAAFAAALAARNPGTIARPTGRTRVDDPFVVLDRFHVAISAVTVVGATAFLLALMVIRAEERRDTVAILRLIGISRRSLLTAVAVEGLLIAGLGAVFGVIVAVGTEGLVNHVFQTRYDTALVFVRVTPPIAARSIAIALPLGLLAGVAASWPLMRGEILSLFRR